MPNFKYTVRDKYGKAEKGSVEAKTEQEVIEQLQSRGYIIVAVEKETEAIAKKDKKQYFHRGVKIDDMALFARQLATLIDAGVPLLKSLNMLIRQISSKPLYEATKVIAKDVEEGLSFRDALAKHPQIFSDFWINVIESGEASGHLPTVLEEISSYIEARSSLQKKIISALVYPVVLICMAIGAIIVFVVKLIPVFSRIFKNFDTELPALTQAVINFSNVFREQLLLIVMVIAAIVYMIKIYANTNKGKLRIDRIKLSLPLFGVFFREMAITRFAMGLSMLIKSGVSILYGLEIIGKTIGNKVLGQLLLEVRDEVREGKTIAEPLEKTNMFPPMVYQLISIGEEIGELAKMLDKIASFYEERVTNFVDRLSTLFEPIILVIVGGVIGVLVVSMFLPIFNLSSAIH